MAATNPQMENSAVMDPDLFAANNPARASNERKWMKPVLSLKLVCDDADWPGSEIRAHYVTEG